jgi:hypothetical protein
MDPNVMEVVHIKLITPDRRKDIINLWLFYKEKCDLNGVFVKDNCQQVCSILPSQRNYNYSSNLLIYNPISLLNSDPH